MLGFLKKLFVRSEISAELSRGQLSLLSDFNISRELKARGWREGWEAVLGVDGDTMLQRFVKLGLIEASPYEDYVNYLTLPQLKSILKKVGLPVSGKKAILVERVLGSGYDISKDFPQKKLWKCSELGLSYAAPFLASEEQRKQHAIAGAKEALMNGDLNLASEIAADYQAKDVFGGISLSGEIRSDGLAVTAKEARPMTSRAEDILKGLTIFQKAKNRRPAPFKDVPDEIFNQAADAVTWSCLQLGKGERKPDAERVALELWNWRSSKENLARYKKSETDGILLGVEILCGDECPIGAAHKGKIYSTSQVPELPLAGCTREPCCACCYTPRVKDL